jgi:hypothetical protein
VGEDNAPITQYWSNADTYPVIGIKSLTASAKSFDIDYFGMAISREPY